MMSWGNELSFIWIFQVQNQSRSTQLVKHGRAGERNTAPLSTPIAEAMTCLHHSTHAVSFTVMQHTTHAVTVLSQYHATLPIRAYHGIEPSCDLPTTIATLFSAANTY